MSGSMRVPLLEDGADERFDRSMTAAGFNGSVPTISRILGHHQDVVDLMQAYNLALRDNSVLSHAETELVILATARAAGNRYAFGRHVSLAGAAGISPEQLSAIATRELSVTLFDERQLTLLLVTEEVVGNLALSDASYAEFTQHFAAVDLPLVLQVIGFYVLLSIVQRGVEAQLEPDFEADLQRHWPAVSA